MPRLFIFIVVFGLSAKYLQEAHGVDFYVYKNPPTEVLAISWIIGVGGIVAALVFIAKILGFGEGKEEEREWYYAEDAYEETYQEEEDEEIYEQPVKVTWWNDYYD